MSVLAEKPRETTRLCPGCGNEFVDIRSSGAPRTYCETCRPPRSLRVVTPSEVIDGKPFTVEHFRAWSAKKKLKDGSYFRLDEYQAKFLADLFARDAADLPVFEELWLVVPEGNGKTTFMALVVLYVIEFKAEAWVPVAASARDQAVDLTYRICSGFVERNKLEDGFKLHPGYRSIIHKQSKGALKIFASDVASGDGVDPDLAVIEELHRLGSMDLYETWAGKLDKSGGQLVIVSTAGEPGGAFETLRAHIRESATEIHRDGCFLRAAAPGVVLHEYAIPEDGDPEDLELVAQANPFSAKTVESLAKKRSKPSWNLSHWRRFTCNLPTRDVTAAITELEWDNARTDEQIPAGTPISAGLDLAWKQDCTALVPLWMRDAKFRVLGEPAVLEPPRDGSSLNPSLVEKAIIEMHARNPLQIVVMDTTHGEQMAQWISSEIKATVIDRSQGSALQAEDYSRFMEALRSGWLRHTGNRVLRQHALNATAKLLPDGRIRFFRPKTSRGSNSQETLRSIDALVAAAMVHCEVGGPSDAWYGL